MSYLDLVLTALGLAMDAFAVAIGKGLVTKKAAVKHSLITGAWFGGFQAVMPLIGFLIGSLFARYVTSFDHWIAFGMLGLIGANMIRGALAKDEETADECENHFGFITMLTMAIATSIDALAVGIQFSTMMLGRAHLIFGIAAIGVITFLLSAVGVRIGSLVGGKFKIGAEITGGIILIGMGTKILIEHLCFGG